MRILSLIVVLLLAQTACATPVIERISIEPENPTTEDKITVSVLLSGYENVTSVKIYYCQGDQCSLGYDMREENGNYSYTFPPGEFKDGEVEFDIVVHYTENGNASTLTEEYALTISPSITRTDGEDNGGDIPGFEALALLAVMTLLIGWKRRGSIITPKRD